MNRDYTFHSYTRTMCSHCQKLIDGKIVYNDKGVFLIKNCPDHGEHRELLEEDPEYHLQKVQYDKPGTTSKLQTRVKDGCPYDCGLCPSHDQHTCIGLIEITMRCNLKCPVCYACAGQGKDLELKTIEGMMDCYMDAEGGKAEILQISGGEPTLHPDILDIIRMAKEKGFKYVMLNTNGIRIAEEEAFVRALSTFKGGFEVYLQFDGLKEEIYQKLRNESVLEMKKKALKNLNRCNIPTTLVCTVSQGVNDDHIGEIIAYGMDESCVRGVNLQPVAYFGRTEERDRLSRVTLSGILNRIEAQTAGLLKKSDFIPLPCDVERVAITYLFKNKSGGFIPITRGKDMREYKHIFNNTFIFTVEDTLRNFKDENIDFGISDCCGLVTDIKKMIPLGFIFKSKNEKMKFVDENTFRISASSFIDSYNFDMKSMQKDCVHVITPDLKRIPFSAYNMIHRGKYDGYYF
ncbi:MAG: radical SAM protein [Eubacteriaceae bacterium]|nr:radical SAM protein [Eubacteriaceae bacterium]